jgi:actin-related protein 8
MVASTAHLHPEGEVAGKSASVQSCSANVPDSTNVAEAAVPKIKTEAGHASPDAESNSKTPTRTGSPEDPGRVSGTGDVGVSTTAAVSAGSSSTGIIYPGGTPIDIRSESSKQPLDHAIFHSIRACAAGTSGVGANERLKKMLACILVVGGTALTPGMLHALESRLVLYTFQILVSRSGMFCANLTASSNIG